MRGKITRRKMPLAVLLFQRPGCEHHRTTADSLTVSYKGEMLFRRLVQWQWAGSTLFLLVSPLAFDLRLFAWRAGGRRWGRRSPESGPGCGQRGAAATNLVNPTVLHHQALGDRSRTATGLVDRQHFGHGHCTGAGSTMWR